MSFWLIVGRNLLVCVVSLSSWSIFSFCLCRLWPVLSHVPVYVFLCCAFFVGLKVRWKQKILVNNLYLLSVITPFRYPPHPPCAKNHWPAKGGKNLVLTLDYWSCMKIIKFSLFVWRSTNTSSPTDNTTLYLYLCCVSSDKLLLRPDRMSLEDAESSSSCSVHVKIN